MQTYWARITGAHASESGRAGSMDWILLWCVIALVLIGLATLSSAGTVLSFENFGNRLYYFGHQLLYGAVAGCMALAVLSRINYRTWKKYALVAMAVTLGLLIAVFIPGISFEYGGARRWIVLFGFSLQPTEVVKLTFLLYLATWLEKRQKGIHDTQSAFWPFVTIIGVIALLVMLQPDLGTLIVILATAIATYFVAGAPWKHLAWLATGGILMVALLIQIAPYRLNRLAVFLHPEKDPQGIGYQVNQGLLAIGSGEWFGRGIGKSIQKYNYLPEPIGDSVFAVMAEELGFVRILFVVFLYLIVAWRGFLIARHATDLYGRLVATGISTWISFQAFVNMGAISGLLPLTGIPLPFISYGGSALMFTLAATGILLNISRYAHVPSVRKTLGL